MIVVGKAAIFWGVLRLFRLKSHGALTTGMCLAQVGEFSFVLAEVARGNPIDEPVFRAVAATIRGATRHGADGRSPSADELLRTGT